MNRLSGAFRLIGASLLVGGVTFAATTCGSDKLFQPPQPAQINVSAGDAQSGTVGAALATEVTVTVQDSHGKGVEGVSVEWTVTSGGGSITGSASPVRAPSMAGGSANSVTATTATSTTGATGTASAVWTLGTTAGPNTLQASLPASLTISPITFHATGVAGPATQLALTTPAGGAASGSPFATQPAVTLRDTYGNAVTSDNSTVVSMTVSTGATIVGTATATASSGVATFSGVGISGTAGTAYTLTFATGSGTVTAATESITPTAGLPKQLELTTAPAGAASGAAFTTQPAVTVRDSVGNQVTSDNTTVVTMTVSGSGSVVGSGTATATGGVATFSGVGISGTAGTAYTLTFGSGTLTTATASITPTAGAPAALVLTRNAAGSASGAAFGTQPIVTVKDGAGNTVTSDNTTVVKMTVSTGGTVVGTDSAKAASGVATFSGVGISGTADSAYTLTFGSGSLTTATQQITPAAGSASQLVLTTNAAGAASGAAFATQPVVAEQDADGNTITSDNTSVVTMTVSTGAGTVGTATATVSSGVATFTDVGITGTADSAYTLTFATGSLTPATQQITPTAGTATKLALTTQAAGAVSGAAFTTQPVVAVQDAQGNTVTTDDTTLVTMTVSGSAGIVGTDTARASSGVATFTDVGITGTSGTAYTLTFAGGTFTSATQSITPTAGTGTKLVLTTAAAGAPSGAAFTTQPVVTEQDAQGNTVSSDNSTVVTMSVSTGATTVGTATATVVAGVATFTDVGITGTAGTSYNLTFMSAPLTSATQSITAAIGPASTSQSTVTVSNASVVSGNSITLTLQATDAGGNNLTTGGLTVVFTSSGGGSTGNIGATTDNGNGTYSATFTGVLAGAATTIGATIAGQPVTSVLPTVTVTVGPVSTAISTVTTSSPTVASGSSVTLTLQAKDAAGNNLPSGGLIVAFTNSGGTSTGTISSTTDNGNGTYTATFTGATAGTGTTIHATIGGNNVTSTLPTVTVTTATASTATSTVSVSSSTVASGSNITLTLQAKDAAGNNLTTGGLVVAFTSSTGAGVSTGTIGSTTDNGDGTYTATFTGVLVGSATTIGATIGGSAVTTTLPGVTVTTGPISVSTSTVSVSSPTVASGSSVTLTLQAKDAAGNNLTAGGSTVAFSATGGTSTGTVSGTTDNANGTYTASFTGITAGSATTIGATIGGTDVTSTLPTVTVTVGNATTATSTISVSSDSVASGNNVTLTLQARDPGGNDLTTGGLTVVFTYSGGTSTGTISGTSDNGDGTYTATFTGGTAGTATTIGATITGSPVTSTLPTVVVTPGVISTATSTVSVSSSTVSSGDSVQFTLQAKDAAGNNLTTGGSSVAFAATGGTSTGSIGTVTDHADGTYTAWFTGQLAGSATSIGATIGGSGVTTTSPTVTVQIGGPSPDSSTVTVSNDSVASGSSLTVTLHTRDYGGNSLTSGGAAVLFTTSGLAGQSTGSFGSTTDNGDGTYEATFTGVLVGTPVSIGATINGQAVTTTLPTVTVTVGPVSTATSAVTASSPTVTSGSAVTLTLQAKDAAGNNLTTGTLAVAFSATGGVSTGTISPTTDNGDGTYTSTFTAVLAGSPTTIHATINSNPVTSTTTVQVTPGDATTATSLVSVSSGTVASGSQITLTMQARDAATNNLATGGLAVTFSAVGGSSTGIISPTIDHNDGTYTATFTGVVSGTPTTIHAAFGGNDVATTLPTVTVIPGPVDTSTSTVTASAATVAAGDSVLLTLQAKDSVGNNETGSVGTVAFSFSGGASTGFIRPVTDHGDGTYTAYMLGQTAGAASTVHATIAGRNVTTAPLPTVQVNVGLISDSTSFITVAHDTVASGSIDSVTLHARDPGRNVVTSGPGATVGFSTSGGSSTGTFGSTTNVGDSTYIAEFTGVAAGTATTIHASINAANVTTSTPPLPTITVIPGPADVTTSVATVLSGSVVSGNSVLVTLQAKDAAGNNLTSGGLTVAFTLSTLAGQSTGTLSAVTDQGDGTYTATFTGVLVGSAVTITGSIGGTNLTTTAPTVIVSVGPISTTGSTLSVSSPTVQAGDSVMLTLVGKDAAGNLEPAGGATVHFNYSSGTSTGIIRPSTATDNADGTYTAYFLAQTAGTATTIGATINGSAVSSLPAPTVTVQLGPISDTTSTITVSSSTVQSGSNVTVTLQLKDPGRNNLSLGGHAIVFSNSTGAGVSTGAWALNVTDNGNGTYTSTFTGDFAGTPTTIHATIDGYDVATTTPPLPTVQVNAGTASKLAFTQQPTNAQVGATLTPVTVQVQDLNGNPVTSYIGDVTLEVDSSTGNPNAALSGGGASPVVVNTVTFSGLSVDKFGRAYKLVARSGALTPGVSTTFNDTLQAAFYVTDSLTNTLSLVDSTSNTVNDVITFPLGSSPWGVAVTPDRKWAYVSLNGSGQVAVVDVSADTVLTYITVGLQPTGVSIDPTGSKVFVANYSAGTMSVIDVATNTVTATPPAGSNPRRMIVRPDQVWIANDNPILTVYARNSGTDSLSLTVSALSVNHNIWDIAARPTSNKRYLYFTIPALDSVYVVDTTDASVPSIVKFGVTGAPSGIAFSSDGSTAFISNAANGTISQIDATAGTPTVTNASWQSGLTDPETMITSPSGGLLYVANRTDGTISVFNVGSGASVATIPVTGEPRSMAFLP